MLIERLFARRDYEGLSEEGKKELESARKKLAKRLKQSRDFENQIEEAIDSKISGFKKSYLKSNKRKYTYQKMLDGSKELSDMAKKEVLRRDREKKNSDILSNVEKSREMKEAAPGFFKRNKKALLIGGGVAALSGAGIYGYKKYKDNKKEG